MSFIESSNGGNNYVAPPIPYSYREKFYSQSRGQRTPTATNLNRNINLTTVFDPRTQTTYVYQQNYTVGTVQAGRAAADLVATAGTDGVYKATSNASNDLRYLIANDKTLQSNLDKQTRYAISNGIKQIEGKTPSAQKINSTFGRTPSRNGSGSTGGGTTPGTPAPGSNPNTSGQTPQSLANLENFQVNDKKANTGTGSYRYPKELPDSADTISFVAYEYGKATFNKEKPGTFNSRSSSFTKIKGDVVIAIPNQISDSNAVSWNEDKMNAVQIAGANISIAGITGDGPGLQKAIEDTVTKGLTGETGKSVKDMIGLWFAGQAVDKTNLATRLTGATLNPNMELLFQGPTLRPFTFTFKFSPRDDIEAKEVINIIRFFKRNMAVRRDESLLFLKTPNIFRISYQHKGKEHNGINKIKECALQSCSVDYTPDGSYMTFDDPSGAEVGSMVSYSLTLQFMELEPIYFDDYESTQSPNMIEY